MWPNIQCAVFEAAKLNNITDPDQCKYFGYGAGFDERGSFSLSNGSGSGISVIKFSADMSSLANIDNKKKRYLEFCRRSRPEVFLGKGVLKICR